MTLSTPTTAELVGGFWSGAYASDVIDAYAAACAYLTDPVTGVSQNTKLKPWVLRADQSVSPGLDGRATVGYPIPGSDSPVWVSTGLFGGKQLVAGVDFSVSDNYVWFETDPIKTAAVRRLDWSTGSPVLTASIWYGIKSTDVVVDNSVDGTLVSLTNTLAVVCDSPGTGITVETVQDVWTNAVGSKKVITDKGAYNLHPNDVPSVAVGQTLPPGSPLGSAWQLTRLGPNCNLPYVTTPSYFHVGITSGNITWWNTSVPTVIDTVSGRTRLRFKLGGTTGDLTAFWADSHARGVASGKTLAQCLDTRPTPTGDPLAADLPTTVNPMRLLCQELIGGCGFQLLIKSACLGPKAVLTANRNKAVCKAAGPYTAVFEFIDTIPSIAALDPP